MEHDGTVGTPDFQTVPGRGHGHAAGCLRRVQFELNGLLRAHDGILCAVGHSHAAPLPGRETEFYRSVRGGFARFLAKREIAGFHLDGACRKTAGLGTRRVGVRQINLNIALAANVLRSFVAALPCVNVVVAGSVAPVQGDPYILKYGTILILVLRGTRRADRKDRSILLDFRKRELRRLLLNRDRNRHGAIATRTSTPEGTLGVHAADCKCDQACGDCRPARVTRGVPVAPSRTSLWVPYTSS